MKSMARTGRTAMSTRTMPSAKSRCVEYTSTLKAGSEPSVLGTMALGIVGSFVGGFLGYLIFHKDAQDGFLQPSGIIGAFIGAVIVLLIWINVGKRRSVRR